jgi:hypothetical protein
VLPSVAQLYFFWLASFILHITMPTLISVNTATVLTSVPIEIDTIPGNIVNLGVGNDFLDRLDDPSYPDDLIGAISALPYTWENRKASIRLPPGVNETSVSCFNDIPFSTKHISPRLLFSTPSNVSSSEYVLTDPCAYALSVRCGVVPGAEIYIEYDNPGSTHNISPTALHPTFYCGSHATIILQIRTHHQC